ncbi:hydroxysqualene dehydroxylase HpnE [Bordetella trematum]|uniref:hydroxysqualene dehydroxylase HpnE n=1 Tax=Bordetella trematum TaxID=123899 RepID=UPI000D8A952A|nr:hydroxysqualene dehydroxylase HpnE [Bordetella trematum]SPU53802.1 zeta-carotene desaturase [Bordetella trematum]VDH06289.1 15-cis-phytoene desaturase [Bordetella trematum]
MKVAVIGAGWAGLAAAAALREADAKVTVFEAGRTPGGRARRVVHPAFGADLDNGQHILLGAYTETLALMRRLGRNPDALLMRRPLRLASLDRQFLLSAPPLPAPLHGAAALLFARGLSLRDKLAALRLVRALRQCQWQPPRDWTVASLMQYHAQPEALQRQVWTPLCVAALNTPPDQASAALFAAVLRDTLNGSRRHSDVLLPCVDLSALWPDMVALQVKMRYGDTVRMLSPSASGVDVNDERFDAAVLAVPPAIAARLLANDLRNTPSAGLLRALQAFDYQPIATLNLRLAAAWSLPEPMLMLREDPDRGHAGQWLFDRARLTGKSPQGELAVVCSTAKRLVNLPRQEAIDALLTQVSEQAARAGLPPLPPVEVAELFIEKRATFAAVPGLARPLNQTPWPSLALAGDWTDTGYPGVLEGAVRSGLNAARVLLTRRKD